MCNTVDSCDNELNNRKVGFISKVWSDINNNLCFFVSLHHNISTRYF